MDHFYESINAPQWVDLSSPLPLPYDDIAWFCRPDCKHPRTAEDFLNSAPPSPFKGGAMVAGGTLALSVAGSVDVKVVQSATEAKRKCVAKPCQSCRGKGFYICKLCKGNATIEWSPLYDLIYINPCQCPTCDGHRIQRCLNCLSKGYY